MTTIDGDLEIIERHEFGTDRAGLPTSRKCKLCGLNIAPGHGWERLRDARGHEIVRHTTPLYFDQCITKATRQVLSRMGFCLAPPRYHKKDVAWIPIAGDNGWTVITADRNIMNNPDERQAIIDHKVKCFILHPQPRGPWEALRTFVAMWSKIQSESHGPGPAVWTVADDKDPSRWTQMLPPPVEYSYIDFSRTPAGHLLNLFASIVTEHDKGWFSRAYVDSLHDAIRIELESRYPGAPPRVRQEQTAWNLVADSSSAAPASDGGVGAQFDEPLNMNEMKQMLVTRTSPQGFAYPWIIAPQVISVVSQDNLGTFDPNRSLSFDFGPTGFRRSGVGLRFPEAADE